MPQSRRVRRERTHDRQQIQQDTLQPEQQGGVASRLPLSALLSQVLVAFTIEFDNEFEHQMPHRTSKHGSTDGSRHAPWLVSLVMWSNCMRLVGEEGVTVGELQRLARTGTNLAGMQRWGYIVVEPDPADRRPKRPRSDAVVHPTPAGRKAQEVWWPLSGVIEQRWQERFGNDEIDQLRKSLWAVASQLDVELPDCLPILGYGLFSGVRHSGGDRSLGTQADHGRRGPAGGGSDSASHLPLAALRFLQKYGYVLIEPDPAASRGKVVRLTSKGRKAQNAYHHLVWTIEERWQTRFGKDTISTLRRTLERLVGEPTEQLSPLFKGLEPYPDGWRAAVRKPDTLPHYPMVLHRGGFPDGS